MIHIVICDDKTKEYNKIINGERKYLIRGCSSRKIPHSRIYVDDELYFTEKNSNETMYHAIVKNADNYSKLSNLELDEMFKKFSEELNLTKEEIKKWKKKCLCVIEFDSLEKIESIKLPTYSPLDNWIMLNNIEEIN